MGAALLKTPEKLCSILEALVKEVGQPFEIGISVKIRLLETPEQTKSLVQKLCATGITGLTVHCRLTHMRPRERAIRGQLKMVAEVCHEAGVACLMNGDVTSRKEAFELAEEYGTDGAMIATAAETNPSCFRTSEDGGIAGWEEVVREYVETAMRVENRWGNTKYLLGQMIPGKSKVYRPMNQCQGYSELVNALGWSEELGTMAQEVDERLEIGANRRETKAEKRARNKAAAKATPATTETKPAESSSASLKRNADTAELDDMPADVARQGGPGSVTEQSSVLAV